jgi:F0F1-type ATP synthase epsilon subunit
MTFQLIIILLNGEEIKKEVESLTCQTELGALTLLANHQPLITVVEPGEVIFKTQDTQEKIIINHKSILEFKNNQAKLIALF